MYTILFAIVYGYFCAMTAELSIYNRDHMAYKTQNISYLIPSITKFLFPEQAQPLNFTEDETQAWEIKLYSNVILLATNKPSTKLRSSGPKGLSSHMRGLTFCKYGF